MDVFLVVLVSGKASVIAFGTVRVLKGKGGGEIWFVAKDVAEVLGYTEHSKGDPHPLQRGGQNGHPYKRRHPNRKDHPRTRCGRGSWLQVPANAVSEHCKRKDIFKMGDSPTLNVPNRGLTTYPLEYSGQVRHVTIIYESGLYSLSFWITTSVRPAPYSIRIRSVQFPSSTNPACTRYLDDDDENGPQYYWSQSKRPLRHLSCQRIRVRL